MDKELVAILLADLVVLTAVVLTAVPALVAEVKLGLAALRRLRARMVARRQAAKLALEQRMVELVEMPGPLPLEQATPELLARMQVRPLSQAVLQAMREPPLRLVPLPPLMPMQSLPG